MQGKAIPHPRSLRLHNRCQLPPQMYHRVWHPQSHVSSHIPQSFPSSDRSARVSSPCHQNSQSTHHIQTVCHNLHRLTVSDGSSRGFPGLPHPGLFPWNHCKTSRRVFLSHTQFYARLPGNVSALPQFYPSAHQSLTTFQRQPWHSHNCVFPKYSARLHWSLLCPLCRLHKKYLLHPDKVPFPVCACCWKIQLLSEVSRQTCEALHPHNSTHRYPRRSDSS